MRGGAATLASAVTGLLVLRGGPALAQEGILAGLQKSVEIVSSSVSTTITSGSGAPVRTDTTNFFPALTLNLNSLVYPNLRLSTGGVFELNRLSSSVGDNKTTSSLTRNRPFFLLRSINPVFAPGVGYFRRESLSQIGGGREVRLVNDERAAYLAWKPAGGPQSDLQFLRTSTVDGDGGSQDLIKHLATLNSIYRSGELSLSYRGAYLKTDDRVARLETRQMSHGVRADYSRTFLSQRLSWNASINVSRQDLTADAHDATGEVALLVSPFEGLSSITDLPLTGRLATNGSLVDGNLTAGAGINLGLPASPADAQSRNIGLDLLTPAEVNRFRVWVDRELPLEVARTFSWDIYSSLDNLVWRRETAISAAPFDPFENRFEIDFPGVTARYIKVVTRPLSAAVPNASRYPEILVTELQAYIRRPAGEAGGKISRNTDLLNTDVRFRILDSPSLYYEGYFLSSGTSGAAVRTDTLSNGLSANHTFSRVFSAVGRLAREQGTQSQGERVATLRSATFTVEPMPAFRSSLLYSGQDEEIGGRPNSRWGLFVQNSARPYQGVDVLFGLGWASSARETGEIAHDRLVNFSATIIPRSRLSLTLSHDQTTTNRSGLFTGPARARQRRSYASVALDPLPTLHLVLGGEIVGVTGQTTRTTLDINASWAPFPDGTLQLVFSSTGALRALEFGSERSTLGGVRWNVSRTSYVDVSYQRTRSEFLSFKTESRIFSARVRLFL